MGQKANPIGQRLGLIKGWDSNWYGGDNYADQPQPLGGGGGRIACGVFDIKMAN